MKLFNQKKNASGKILISLLIFICIFNTFLPVVSAQSPAPAPTPTETPPPTTSPSATNPPQPLPSGSPASTGTGNSDQQSVEDQWQCLNLNPFNFYFHPVTCMAFLGVKMMKLSAWVFWAVGVAFNYIVVWTVTEMAKHIKNDLPAINIAWKAFRDLANIFFIFILLYIAIATILQLSKFDTKKTLTNLIILALLINFSLFFAQVIIDASNRFAYEFYKTITIDGPNGTRKTLAEVGLNDAGLSDAFLSRLQFQTLYQPGQNGQSGTVNGSLFDPKDQSTAVMWKIFLISMLGTIVIIVAALVFLAGCVIFIKRFITLVVLMIFSALGFMAGVLPYTSKHSSSWWHKLISEVIVAPVFFMMIWVVLTIIPANGLIRSGGFSSFAEGAADSVGIIFNFIIIIGLLVATLIISSLTGASGGALALQTFQGARTRLQGALGRNTVGRLAYKVNEGLQNSRFGNTRVGDSLRRMTAAPLATAKFGSKMSAKDAVEKEEKQDKARAKFEFERLEKNREKTFKKESARDADVVAGKQLLQEAEERLYKERQNYQNAGTEPEKKAAQANALVAYNEREQAKKDLVEAEGQLKTKLGASLGTLVEKQAQRAEEMMTSYLNVGAKRGAAKLLRESALEGKTYKVAAGEKEQKATASLLQQVVRQMQQGGGVSGSGGKTGGGVGPGASPASPAGGTTPTP